MVGVLRFVAAEVDVEAEVLDAPGVDGTADRIVLRAISRWEVAVLGGGAEWNDRIRV